MSENKYFVSLGLGKPNKKYSFYFKKWEEGELSHHLSDICFVIGAQQQVLWQES